MIDEIIKAHRQQKPPPIPTQPSFISQPPQPQPLYQPSQLLLVISINLILLTITLTLFNITLLLVFITITLKYYKTYIMQKHVDEIEIPLIETKEKTSMFVHLLARLVHGVLTEKSVGNNVKIVVGLLGVYAVLRLVPGYMCLVAVVNAEYARILWNRYQHNEDINHKNQSNIGSKITNDTSTMSMPQLTFFTAKFNQKNQQDDSQDQYYNDLGLKPLGQTFGQSQLPQQSQIKQMKQSMIRIDMEMIEEVSETNQKSSPRKSNFPVPFDKLPMSSEFSIAVVEEQMQSEDHIDQSDVNLENKQHRYSQIQQSDIHIEMEKTENVGYTNEKALPKVGLLTRSKRSKKTP